MRPFRVWSRAVVVSNFLYDRVLYRGVAVSAFSCVRPRVASFLYVGAALAAVIVATVGVSVGAVVRDFTKCPIYARLMGWGNRG